MTIRLALVGSHYRNQTADNQDKIREASIVWVGESVDDLARTATASSPNVIVVDLRDLGADPTRRLDELLARTGARLVIVTYAFARRDVVQSLQSSRTRVIPGPLTLSTLRSQMLALIDSDPAMQGDSSGSRRQRGEAGRLCPTCQQPIPVS